MFHLAGGKNSAKCIGKNSSCWTKGEELKRTLPSQTSWGMEGVVCILEVKCSAEDLCEHPGRNVTPMPEGGGPRHPHRGLGITEELM